MSKGIIAIGQAAIALFFALGQFTAGHIAIGQIAIGTYVLAQLGLGEFAWTTKRADAQAIEFFKSLPFIQHLIP